MNFTPIRSSDSKCFFKKAVLKNSAFAGKYPVNIVKDARELLDIARTLILSEMFQSLLLYNLT